MSFFLFSSRKSSESQSASGHRCANKFLLQVCVQTYKINSKYSREKRVRKENDTHTFTHVLYTICDILTTILGYGVSGHLEGESVVE